MTKIAAQICSLALAGSLVLGAGTTAGTVVAGEQLTYSINWPSGLNLGEAHLAASDSGQLTFTFDVQAAVPAFVVSDIYTGSARQDFCSIDATKSVHHGPKRYEEKTFFDQTAGTATRETKGGGKADFSTSSCAKDALTFLYFVRHELAHGRLPQTQTVYFGAPYQMRVVFAGTQSVRVGEKPTDTDHVTVSLKGQNSDLSFDVFFLKDAARTPALVKVPFSLGTFSMELVK